MSRTSSSKALRRSQSESLAQAMREDESFRVWLSIDNVDAFRLAVVAAWRDGEAVDANPFGDEALNVERLARAAADAVGTSVDTVHDNIAGRLMGMERATSCVRCGDVDYSPTCPSCVLDAGCSIG